MKAALKKLWLFIRRTRIWASVLLIVVALSIFLASDNLSDKIGIFVQAAAIIILALITWDYALQTRKLAEEQKNTLNEYIAKRNIGFVERQITDFYMPATIALTDLLTGLNLSDSKNAQKAFFDLANLYFNKRPLASEAVADKIHLFIKELKDLLTAGRLAEASTLFSERLKDLQTSLIRECLELEYEIRNFYRR